MKQKCCSNLLVRAQGEEMVLNLRLTVFGEVNVFSEHSRWYGLLFELTIIAIFVMVDDEVCMYTVSPLRIFIVENQSPPPFRTRGREPKACECVK